MAVRALPGIVGVDNHGYTARARSRGMCIHPPTSDAHIRGLPPNSRHAEFPRNSNGSSSRSIRHVPVFLSSKTNIIWTRALTLPRFAPRRIFPHTHRHDLGYDAGSPGRPELCLRLRYWEAPTAALIQQPQEGSDLSIRASDGQEPRWKEGGRY
ncbi:hypothetical protein FA95DRAFT_1094615 [Auriscalpium vulgare]|uniref:Uncharacterized protein n=1 Tax=Auriscalpium vulgare TaxID=40419 RepID=A0ACB8R4V7_9AGAM|nr:hypothetical protein FA95DRAFT_1094615 [Auriscalpium vulgare]